MNALTGANAYRSHPSGDPVERVGPGEGVAGEPIDGVRPEPLAAGERTNARTFEIEPGAEVPGHSHPDERVRMATCGPIAFLVEGEELGRGPVGSDPDHLSDPESEVRIVTGVRKGSI